MVLLALHIRKLRLEDFLMLSEVGTSVWRGGGGGLRLFNNRYGMGTGQSEHSSNQSEHRPGQSGDRLSRSEHAPNQSEQKPRQSD